MFTSVQTYDFYSPFMSAAIITPQGDRVPLWTNTSTDTGFSTAFGAVASRVTGLNGANSWGSLTSLPFLRDLTIRLDLAYLPQMTAVLTPPMSDARILVDSPIMEWGQSVLQAQVGYTTGTGNGGVALSPVFEGLLFKPEVNIGTEYTITLKTQGVAGYSMGVVQNQKTYKGKRRDVIEQVVAGQGTEGRALKVVFKDIEKDSTVSIALNTEINENQGGLTDWMYLWQLVRDAGCWLSYIGDSSESGQASLDPKSRTTSVVIYPRNVRLASKAKFTLRWFDYPSGRIGPGLDVPGVYPILSASSPTSAVFLPGATRALVAQGVASKTGEPVISVATPSNTPTARLGGGAVGVNGSPNAPEADSKTGEGGAPLPVWTDDPKFKDLPKAELANLFSMGVKLEVQTLGIPDVQPGDIVAVKGLGGRFDFNYAVFTVTHQIGSGGFFTSLTMQSNTSAILADYVKGIGTANPNPTSEESASKVMIEAKGRGSEFQAENLFGGI